MRSSGSQSPEYLRGVACLDAFKPLVCAPAEGAVVIQVPPSETINGFGPADHMKYGSFLQHFCHGVVESSAAAKAKPRSFGVCDSNVVSDSDKFTIGSRCDGRFDGREQSGIQAFRAEVLFADSAKLHGFAY